MKLPPLRIVIAASNNPSPDASRAEVVFDVLQERAGTRGAMAEAVGIRVILMKTMKRNTATPMNVSRPSASREVLIFTLSRFLSEEEFFEWISGSNTKENP